MLAGKMPPAGLVLVVLLVGTLVGGQRSTLNDYQRSKGMMLLHLLRGNDLSADEIHLSIEECATHCNTLRDCRAFNYNYKTFACELLTWTQYSVNTQLQRNIHYDLYQRKGYVRNCIMGTGEDYRGTVSTTEKGKTCQQWRAQYPHDHRYTSDTKNGLEENYCRNPNKDQGGPWCYTTDPYVRHQYCKVKKCEEAMCLQCNGEDYRGSVDHTEHGIECQRWDMQIPHKHPHAPEKYPDKSLNDNYCRNPDNSERPWCYTTDSSIQRQYCHIQKCTEKQRLQNVEFTSSCFKEKGVGYRGRANFTTSGIPCQRWDSQAPHQHNFLPDNYQCKGLEENYCRNPDGSEAPWCFTTLKNMRVAFCFQIKRCPEDVPVEDCYYGNGEHYRGKVSKTRKGITCQKWSDQQPHKSIFSSLSHPNAGLDENYCRNPDGDRHGPWCFTMDPKTQFDYCAISHCAGNEEPLGNEDAENVTFESCGKREERLILNARVVGGEPGNSPWTVSLRNRNGEHFCGGSLVKENWIISTRQCFSSCDADLTGYQAYLGTLLKFPTADDPNIQAIPISRIVCGPGPDSYLVMLKLEWPAVLNTRVALICLPPDGYIVPENTQCEIAGWGETKGTGFEDVLKVAKLTIMSNIKCNNVHRGRVKVKENEICTTPKPVAVGACEGDFGGPLACLAYDCYVLEGVIVPGRGCGKTGQPAIFIRTSHYVDWINKVMKMI